MEEEAQESDAEEQPVSLLEREVSFLQDDSMIHSGPTSTRSFATLTSTSNIFMELPTDLSLHILKFWLGLRDISRLDVAMLNRADRPMWLQMLHHTVITHGTVNIRERELHKLQWLVCRQAYCTKVAFRNCKIRDIAFNPEMTAHWERMGKYLKCLRFKEKCSVATPLMVNLILACPRLEELHINCRPQTGFNSASFRLIADNCANLKTVYFHSIYDINADDWDYFAKKCPNVHELGLEQVVLPPVAIHSILREMAHLSKLNLKHCSLPTMGIRFHQDIQLPDHIQELSTMMVEQRAQLLYRADEFASTPHTALQSVDFSHSKELCSIVMQFVLRCCPNIERLNVSFCTLDEYTFSLIAQYLLHLKTLFLPGCSINDDTFVSLVSRCTSIETLVLGYSPLLSSRICDAMASHLNNLRTFALWGNLAAFTETSMTKLAKSCCRIDKIALTHMNIDDATLTALVRHCKISRIEINGCSSVGDSWMHALSHNCAEHLTHFVAEQVRISDVGCVELAKCAKLEYVNISHTVDVTNAGLELLLRSCRKISVLRIKGCNWVVDDTLTIIAEHGRQVKELDLSNNDHITAEGILSLVSTSQRLHRLLAYQCINLNILVQQEQLDKIKRVAKERRLQFSF